MTHKKIAEDMIDFHLNYGGELGMTWNKEHAKQSALLGINSELNVVMNGGKMNLYKSRVTKTMVFGKDIIIELKAIQHEIEKI